MAVSVDADAALQSGKINGVHTSKLVKAGYSDAKIQELFAQAGLVNMLNTIANILGIKNNSELIELDA